MTYLVLPIQDFGRHLVVTGDLDPIYIALDRMEWGEPQLCRWLLSYWLCYHAGLSSWLSEHEGNDYWHHLNVAAVNAIESPVGGRWPRATERRHWRGAAATTSVRALRETYHNAPEDMVRWLSHAGDPVPVPFSVVARRVQSHLGFGPWIAFKACDMLERVCGVPVQFSAGEAIYDSPKEAALDVWRASQGLDWRARPKNHDAAVGQVVDWLLSELGDLWAPPKADRRIGYQEVETVLCKYKAHAEGRYAVGHDIVEIREGIAPWTNVCETALLFAFRLPTVP